MPTSIIATISSAVATGRMMNKREGFIALLCAEPNCRQNFPNHRYLHSVAGWRERPVEFQSCYPVAICPGHRSRQHRSERLHLRLRKCCPAWSRRLRPARPPCYRISPGTHKFPADRVESPPPEPWCCCCEFPAEGGHSQIDWATARCLYCR